MLFLMQSLGFIVRYVLPYHTRIPRSLASLTYVLIEYLFRNNGQLNISNPQNTQKY